MNEWMKGRTSRLAEWDGQPYNIVPRYMSYNTCYILSYAYYVFYNIRYTYRISVWEQTSYTLYGYMDLDLPTSRHVEPLSVAWLNECMMTMMMRWYHLHLTSLNRPKGLTAYHLASLPASQPASHSARHDFQVQSIQQHYRLCRCRLTTTVADWQSGAKWNSP